MNEVIDTSSKYARIITMSVTLTTNCRRSSIGVTPGDPDKTVVSLLTHPSLFPAPPLTSWEFVKAFTSVPSAELSLPVNALAIR